MSSAARHVAQFLVVLAVMAAAAWLSAAPAWRTLPAGSAVLLLTFVHGADRSGECRRLTAEEIARLPPNMRRVQDCPRGRRPVQVELDVDGRALYRAELAPTGIAGDGPSRVYQRFVMTAGSHDVAVRMRDTPRAEGFDHERRETVAMAPGQLLVVDYRPEAGGFVFR
ncbi:hypothetical protein ACVIJ6_003416 [Bradyrhizobium sp. USDA 4369]